MVSAKKIFAAVLLASATSAAPSTGSVVAREAASSQANIDSGAALKVLAAKALENTKALARANKSGCTPDKIRYRKEWRTLSKDERKKFIAAMQCMKDSRASPSLYNSTFMPGSKSLYDSYVGVHLIQTPLVHFSATFLTWHRYYINEFEKSLSKCGYKGTLPYWEWGLDVNGVEKSPVFDGSDTSLGGNGEYIPHAGMQIQFPFPGAPVIYVPPGTGGGCVRTGPFCNLTVSLGPVAVQDYGSPAQIGVANPLLDNTRCLKRDLNTAILKRFASFRNTTEVVTKYNNIELFQAYFTGDPRYILGEVGVHGGGHYTMGGDPGSDPFVSPGDPAFWVHHAQVDRIWWIWQMQDFANRQGVFGTGTLLDFPPSPNVTVEDKVDLGPIAPPVKIKTLQNVVGNTPFCYAYI